MSVDKNADIHQQIKVNFTIARFFRRIAEMLRLVRPMPIIAIDAAHRVIAWYERNGEGLNEYPVKVMPNWDSYTVTVDGRGRGKPYIRVSRDGELDPNLEEGIRNMR